uniref:ryncolin-1-like n=1 Tax=Styela clava TaxID=7725 RepID=UPI00193AD432|nr:ryncolin-1-like [Styela clava]
MRAIVLCILFGFVHANDHGTGLTPPYTCTTTVCKPGQPSVDNEGEAMNQGRPGKRGPSGMKGDKGDPCQCDIADTNAMAELRAEWEAIKEKFIILEGRLRTLEDAVTDLPENCSSYMEMSHQSSIYEVVPIYPLKFIGELTSWMTNCKKAMAEKTDGWVTVQRRVDGGTDFYRNWESYVRGFGDRNGEFWIGLRRLHRMTSDRKCKLRIDFRDWDKSTKYAEYTTFQVDDEASDFRLTVSGYSGNIQDSMAHHNNRRFSTFDRDNDVHPTIACAVRYKGAWWHGNCHDSNLNGQYFKTKTNNNVGVWWDGFSYSLPYVEMKLLCI